MYRRGVAEAIAVDDVDAELVGTGRRRGIVDRPGDRRDAGPDRSQGPTDGQGNGES